MTRHIGPAGKAAFCAGCGALVPNTWSDPRGYVHVGELVYCDAECERIATTPQTNTDPGYLEGGNYGA
jgi:hypothetical protein